MAAYSTDQFMGQPSGIHLVNIADDLADQKADVIKSLTGPKGRITRVGWTDLNRTLVTAGEDGFVRRWDVEVRLQRRSFFAVFVEHGNMLFASCLIDFSKLMLLADWQNYR